MCGQINSKTLTEQERREQIEYHLRELKRLRATPRSDWHAGFEALLRIETHKYADHVHISTEEEIGEVPPRTDFVILVEDEQVEWEKAVFGIFRGINVIEYKNPHDALNSRVIRKACGYANLYIGVAEREGDRPEDQVTISIFRAGKNPELFERMERAGMLVRSAVPGIYRVRGYTDLPFQIIITDELEGEEYAAYRALTDRADQADVERIIAGVAREEDDTVREHYRVLLQLVMEKNPQFIETMRRDSAMEDILMEIVKDRVEAKVNTAVSTAVTAEKQQTTVAYIKEIMTKLKYTAEQAMDLLGVPQSQRGMYAGLVGKGTS